MEVTQVLVADTAHGGIDFDIFCWSVCHGCRCGTNTVPDCHVTTCVPVPDRYVHGTECEVSRVTGV